jgi:non-heme chloroperoxidase
MFFAEVTTMAFLETAQNISLFYRDFCKAAEPRTAETLVFVASQSMPSDIWNYNLPFFTDHGMRCVAFDRRGHGRSDAPSTGYDIDTLARDLASLLARLELSSITLVGHSLGGAEVVRYLSHHAEPGRVRRAVLIGPTTPRLPVGLDYPQGFDPAAVSAVHAGWRTDFVRWVDENKRPFFAPETSNALVDWGARLMEAMPLYVQLEISRTTANLDLRADLALIHTPTLIIHGDLDRSLPVSFAAHTAELMPNARLKRYAEAAHGVFITHSEQVHRDILEFIQTGK